MSRAEVNKQMDRTLRYSATATKRPGSLWILGAGSGDHISFVSVYVMDFLSEAKKAHFNPPSEMFASGLLGLQKIVRHDPG